MAGGNPIELRFDLLDRTDQRPGDGVTESESKQNTAEREGDYDQLRLVVSLPASFDTSYHVRLSFVDQLVGQTLETIGQGRSLHRLHLSRLRGAAGANHIHAMRDNLDKSIVVVAELAKQFDFIFCHELQSIDVIAELVKLAKGARQRLVVRRKQGRGNAVELAYRVMLDLPIGFDLALQSDEFLGALIDPVQNLESYGPDHDEQHRNGEKCRKQFNLYASRYPRNQVDHPSNHRHHGSCRRLKRSRRNSSGSKRTPAY